MRNAEYAAFTNFRDNLRRGAARALLEYWQQTDSALMLGRLQGHLEVLAGLEYSHGLVDELSRAARLAHKYRGDLTCRCGKVMCGGIDIPTPDGRLWSPPAPARRAKRTEPLAPLNQPDVAGTPDGLIDLGALFAGDVRSSELDPLFADAGDMAANCLNRTTLLALRWCVTNMTLDEMTDDMDGFLDLRPAKGLARKERWQRVGQYANFAANDMPRAPFSLLGAEVGPGGFVQVWWESAQPVTLQGRDGRYVSTTAPGYYSLNGSIAGTHALVHAADLGWCRFGDEFIGAFAPTNVGARIGMRADDKVLVGETSDRKSPWVSEAQVQRERSAYVNSPRDPMRFTPGVVHFERAPIDLRAQPVE